MHRRLRLPGSDLRALLGDAVPDDHSRQQLADGWIPRVLDPAVPAPRVLDLGCGAGGSRELFRAHHPGVRWTGLDVHDSPSPPPSGDPDIALYDGTRIPFADGSFDVVFCKQVLEHVTHPRAVLAEVARVLAPGGAFAGSTSQLEPFHARSTFGYTAYGLALLLGEAGFRVQEIRPGIDGLTLTARSLSRRAALFGRWFGRDSPLNRGLDLAGRVAGSSPAEVNAAKLKFSGQLAFLATLNRE